MNDEATHLELLITRFLDGECSDAERRELDRLIETDAEARDLYEELSALDRELGAALRAEFGGRRGAHPRRRWPLMSGGAGLATAACLLLALWMGWRGPRNVGDNASRASFADYTWCWPGGDTEAREEAPLLERPRTGVRHTTRSWIVVPGRRDGEFYLIEMNQVRTNAIAIQRDF